MASESIHKPQDRQAWIQQSDPEIQIFYTECRPLSNERLYKLVTEHLGIKDRIRLVGHEIGGMIAHAYVAQFTEHVASINWGECPLPGMTFYEEAKHTPPLWHFDFQAQTDITVTLVTGKEKLSLKHFYDRLAQNQAGFPNEVVDFYRMRYSAAGALHAAFTTYRMFEEDARMNTEWREKNRKVGVRAMVMSGEYVFITAKAGEMTSEVYENVEKGVVEGCGHYLTEENREGLVTEGVGFR